MTSAEFYARYFPQARPADWMNWKWQLRNRVRSYPKLAEVLGLPDFTTEQIQALSARMPLGATPYYLSIAQNSPLQSLIAPSLLELSPQQEESLDPMDEEAHSPLPGVIRKYPNRALLYLTPFCPIYCRYCTRGRVVGRPGPNLRIQQALSWLQGEPEINEIILSGGDPLFLEDQVLADWLIALRALPQIQVLRISSKVPLALPQRITDRLVEVLSQAAPLYLNLHVVHPHELTDEVVAGLKKLREGGVILGSQCVLLKGVNDQSSTQLALHQKLLASGVRPYALYYCDAMAGAGHFRSDLETGLEIVTAMRKSLGGMALPQLVADPKGGKVNLHPQTLLEKGPKGYRLKNWQEEEVFYPSWPRA